MKTIEQIGIDPEVLADLEEVCRQTARGGILRDPELVRRITGRADRARAEMVRRFGVQDISVEIIREARDAE